MMVNDSILYAVEPNLDVEEFRSVLIASSLGERRPIKDTYRLDRMLAEADIIATARIKGKLIGVSRAITDFSYCCYLSDLAVDSVYQGRGIGRKLIDFTHAKAGKEETTLFLVAAPAAIEYYPKIGMESFPCFGFKRNLPF